MVLLVQTPPPMRWRTRLFGYATGLAVGMALILGLRSTGLTPPMRVFLASLPMWFLFTLSSDIGGPAHPWPKRIIRSTAYALLVSAGMYWIMRLG